MTNIPTVSVIVPIYNTERFLNRCVDSILAQTFKDIEIILVNDGSKDNSKALIDNYVATHDNIKAVHQENKGLAEARHTGIKIALGEYIMNVDSDDWLQDDAISFLLDKCQEYNLDIAYGVMRQFQNANKTHDLLHPSDAILSKEEYLAYLLSNNAVCSCCASLSKRSLWKDEIFPENNAIVPSEDVIMTVKMSEFVDKVGLFNKAIYIYFYNALSLTSTGLNYDQKQWVTFFNDLTRNLKQRGELERFKDQLEILKIDRIAFYIKHIDKNCSWYKDVISYERISQLPLRYKILMLAIRYSIIKSILNKYRKLKRLINKSNR
ncbi:MAG: glycosyltransferase family 2 protein [Muribaculaceae bacterium]